MKTPEHELICNTVKLQDEVKNTMSLAQRHHQRGASTLEVKSSKLLGSPDVSGSSPFRPSPTDMRRAYFIQLLSNKPEFRLKCECCAGYGHAETVCPTKQSLLSQCQDIKSYKNAHLAWLSLVKLEHECN